jgi:hypothetical protein
MSFTLLQLVQAACGELGLTVPTSVVGNSAQDAVQLFALANAVGGELQREYDWQFLSKEYRFTTQFLSTTGNVTASSQVITSIPSTTGLDTTYMVTGTGINQDTYVQSVDSGTQVTLSQNATISGTGVALTFGKTKYSLPSDYDRQVDNTHYDKSKRWQMLGPETAQQWQFLKSSYISTGPRLRYRIMGGYFQIWPMLGTPEYCGFEYQSNGWVNPMTTATSTFQADTDVCAFPDRLMIDGIKYFYLRAKGFTYDYALADFNRHLSIAKANDHGSPKLSMAPRLAEVLIGIDQVPDTGYGS